MKTFNPIEHATLSHIVQTSALAFSSGSLISLRTSMGVPELDEIILTKDFCYEMYPRIEAARRTSYKTWRGFDVRHLINQTGIEFLQFDVFSALEPGVKYLTQEILDFITLRDKDAVLEVFVGVRDELIKKMEGMDIEMADVAEDYLTYDDIDLDRIRLTLAFAESLVREGKEQVRNISAGSYILKKEPLPGIDSVLGYDEMRVVILPAGIFGAIIKNDRFYVPFWWDAALNETLQVWIFPKLASMFTLVFAALWRDACVTEEKVFKERRDKGRGYINKSTPPPKQQSNVLRLPKIVYQSQWGSDTDREIAEQVARRSHSVRGHYRHLGEDRKPSEEAIATAQAHGYPEPPDEYTFVKPHTRGQGEAITVIKRVISKGLLTLKTVLG